MDFGSLLDVAQKNEQGPKKEIRYYSTKFEPPKKEERSKQLSSNIKKFLARKEAEEKQKAEEAKERLDKLLDLRSHDRKSTRRVAVMLKRTKSANKSVIQDAVDHDNTAVTLAGPSQPDEDDYGYVSQEASAYYTKMMQKYNNLPEEDKKFAKSKKNVNTNLKEIKDRVRAAIEREQEEALLPHKRKRKPKETGTQEDYFKEEEKEKPEEKPKKKPRPPPPVINFNDLLKLAEKKQFEPIKLEPKVKSEEDERPMTKRQKREFEKEQVWRERKNEKLDPRANPNANGKEPSKPSDKMGPPPNKIPKLNSSSSSTSNGKIPKLSGPDDRRPQSSSRPIPQKGDDKFSAPRRPDDRIPKKSDDRNANMSKKSEIKSNNGVQNQSASSDRKSFPSKESKLRSELEKPRSLPPKLNSNGNSSSSSSNNRPQLSKPNNLDKNKSLTRKDVNGRPKGSLNDRPKQIPPADSKPKQFPPSDVRPKQFPPTDVRPKQFPPSNGRPKQFPPSDLKPKQFPPSDLRNKQFPPPDVRRRPKDAKRKPPMGHKRRILDDDDSEYDSEMDDFIDDDGEDADYSKHISEIFGYDKSKYKSYDDEDDNMESSFSQMMREEFISGKLGLMEDLEDMKLEEEAKKKKIIMKKKAMRK